MSLKFMDFKHSNIHTWYINSDLHFNLCISWSR